MRTRDAPSFLFFVRLGHQFSPTLKQQSKNRSPFCASTGQFWTNNDWYFCALLIVSSIYSWRALIRRRLKIASSDAAVSPISMWDVCLSINHKRFHLASKKVSSDGQFIQYRYGSADAACMRSKIKCPNFFNPKTVSYTPFCGAFWIYRPQAAYSFPTYRRPLPVCSNY